MPTGVRMITQDGPGIANVIVVTMACLLFAACAGQPPAKASARDNGANAGSAEMSVGIRAAGVATRQVGVPYRYGGNSRDGFDCSGLVQFAYARVGKSVPRTTGQLWSASETVPRDRLQPGDLLFFRIAGKMSHVGMYIGNREFVHAPSSGRSVTVASLDAPFYADALMRTARPR